MPELTKHAAQRMEERGIDLEAIDQVLRRPIGAPEPGRLGNLVHTGLVHGRRLKVVLSPDENRIVTAYWEGQP